MRVVTSCSGRFWLFDQARELARHDLLHTLIADYPRWKAVRFGVPRTKIVPLRSVGSFGYGLRRYSDYMPEALRNKAFNQYHRLYGHCAAAALPESFDAYIGLSSFSLEAIKICRARGIPCAVDHGSLHIGVERKILTEETKRWGVSMPKDFGPDWIIERENTEFQLADRIFALSRVAKRSLIQEGIAEDKVFVNPCGVDLTGFLPGQKTESGFRILQVGGISLRKGVLDLARACAMAEIKGAELEFVGGGLKASNLQKLIEQLAIKRVRFTGSIPQERLKERYHQASVFVLASLADGFGMVVTQAMACGLPVIVTENVGAADLVRDGVNGFIVPIRSPEIIAQKLVYLYENPAITAQMGKNARATIEQGFSWVDYGNRLADYLRQWGRI